MLGILIRRITIAIPTMLIISLLVFSLQNLLPGDPALAIAGEHAGPELIEAIRQQYGLNDPFLVQYWRWLGSALQGDFGVSYRTREDIGAMILQKIPVTATLAVASIIISLGVGIPAGIAAATWRGKWDFVVQVFSISGISLPHFWLGIMLIIVFGVHLKWFPVGGYVSFFDDPVECIRHIAMPAFVLGTSLAAAMMRHTRGAMLAVLQQDYVRTARAKGLAEHVVILSHAFRNAQVPIITLATLQFGALIGGAILTEQVFSLPGIGKMVVDAVFNREYSAIQAVTLLSGLAFIVMSLVADILYLVVNPKIRTGQ